MQYLTPAELRKIAPATQKMPDSDENLVSTKAFLRHVEKLGFQPIFAAQGTAHADADAPLKSRHLTVTADNREFAVAILNSHTIWRRAWVAVGFAASDQFVLGAAVPLPRWRGFGEPLASAVAYKSLLNAAKDALEDWAPNEHQRRWLAKQFSVRAYLKGHKQPLSKALVEVEGTDAFSMLFSMLAAARKGGLPPAPNGNYMPPRKLKPIIAPDALMHAASQTWQVGMAGLRKYKLGDYAFPAFTTGR